MNNNQRLNTQMARAYCGRWLLASLTLGNGDPKDWQFKFAPGWDRHTYRRSMMPIPDHNKHQPVQHLPTNQFFTKVY